jgi:hypothetical protein
MKTQTLLKGFEQIENQRVGVPQIKLAKQGTAVQLRINKPTINQIAKGATYVSLYTNSKREIALEFLREPVEGALKLHVANDTYSISGCKLIHNGMSIGDKAVLVKRTGNVAVFKRVA